MSRLTIDRESEDSSASATPLANAFVRTAEVAQAVVQATDRRVGDPFERCVRDQLTELESLLAERQRLVDPAEHAEHISEGRAAPRLPEPVADVAEHGQREP